MRQAQQSKRKRDYHPQSNFNENTQQAYEAQLQERQRALAVLHVQAHEADIVHGTTAKARARALEVDSSRGKPYPGTALIKLEAASIARASANQGEGHAWGNEDGESVFTLSGTVKSGGVENTKPAQDGKEKGIWVDRYDARLLLDSLTSTTLEDEPGSPSSSSSSGWSDFPEDSEDTFFLSRAEAEDYHRAKRRRLLDNAWEQRIKEREAEEAGRCAPSNPGEDGEVPPETLLLMQRTAKHLLSASNPAQLEMKILANYGADQRFSFLRDGSQWHKDWLEVNTQMKEEKAREEKGKKGGSGLGGLTAYGSESDSESNEEVTSDPGPETAVREPPLSPTLIPPSTTLPPPGPLSDFSEHPRDLEEERLKEERRARAREWMRKRKSEGRDGT